jgi:hypothetical protein
MIISSFLIGFIGPGGVRLRLPALVSGNSYWSGLTEKIGHNSCSAPPNKPPEANYFRRFRCVLAPN